MGKGGGFFIAIVIILFIMMASSCSSKSSYMSDEYNSDSKYRKNVDSVADTYDKSSKEVDDRIHAVENAMKKNK